LDEKLISNQLKIIKAQLKLSNNEIINRIKGN